MTPSTPRRSKPRRGWAGASDLLANPVPGNVLEAVEELGVEIYRIGVEEAHGHCPAHEEFTGKRDRHPSWSVNLESGEHNCFACEFGGGFVGLAQYMLGCSRLEAVTWIRARGAIEYVKRKLTKQAKPEIKPALSEAALALFTDPPLSECSKRLLNLTAVQEMGVLWDPAKQMWITPIRDPDKYTLLGWQEKNAKYFRNRPRDVLKSRTLFGIHLFDGPTAILVESPLDAVRLKSVGISGGLASFGAGVSAAQMSLIIDYADDLILALDNPAIDRDGGAMTLKLLAEYSGRIPMRVLRYPNTEVKDPGDMSADQLHTAVRSAMPALAARAYLKELGFHAH